MTESAFTCSGSVKRTHHYKRHKKEKRRTNYRCVKNKNIKEKVDV